MVLKSKKSLKDCRWKKLRHIDDRIKKTLILSDVHIPYQDDKAISAAFNYARKYQPDNIVLNGDVMDFYGLSTFDKSPDRKDTVAGEIMKGRKWLSGLRRRFSKANIYFLQGNHENRLQKYLWRNPELHGLDSLELKNLLRFKHLKIKETKVDAEYWGKDTGHLKIGDAIIMHGDSRLNGSSSSKYSGYSAKNTMMGIQQSVVMGHIHRLAHIKHRTPYGYMTGVEAGCLCIIPGNANWQQGFATFETYKGKNYNYKIHHIQDGKLIEDGKVYQ